MANGNWGNYMWPFGSMTSNAPVEEQTNPTTFDRYTSNLSGNPLSWLGVGMSGEGSPLTLRKTGETLSNRAQTISDRAKELGFIEPTGEATQMGMFPNWSGIMSAAGKVGPALRGLFSWPGAGVYGATEMAGAQGNEMMGAYNAANAAGLNLEDYIERDGTRVSINPQFYQDAATPVDAEQTPPGVFPETEDIINPYTGGRKHGETYGALGPNPFGFPSIMKGLGAIRDKLRPSPEEQFGASYFPQTDTGRVYQDPNQSLFGGMNVDTMLGEGIGGAGQKRIDRLQKTIDDYQKQWGHLDQDEYDMKLKRRRDQLKEFKIQQTAYSNALAAQNIQAQKDKAAADTIAQQRAQDRAAGAFSSQVRQDPGGGGTWQRQTRAKERQGQQVAGPGFGKGAYFTQGGRVGYKTGGRVGILAAF